MSGGAFNYRELHIEEIAECIRNIYVKTEKQKVGCMGTERRHLLHPAYKGSPSSVQESLQGPACGAYLRKGC